MFSRFFGAIHAVVLFSFCLTVVVIGCAIPRVAFADSNPTIFDVRRSLPLEPDEPVAHDFYINAGSEAGLKKGSFITAVRELSVHDPVQNKQQGTLNIKIGRLQIIHVERNITIARLEEEFTDDDRPAVDFESVMIGDKVDLASITSENSSSGKKKKAKAKHVADAKSDETSSEGISAAKAAETAVVVPQVMPATAALAQPRLPTTPGTPPAATALTQPAASAQSAPAASVLPRMPSQAPSGPQGTDGTTSSNFAPSKASGDVVSAPVPAPRAKTQAAPTTAPLTGALNEEKSQVSETTTPAS
jgi:hypothetical protein